MKYTLEEIEKMLENFKTQNGEVIFITLPNISTSLNEIISDLVEECRKLRNEIDKLKGIKNGN